MNEKRTTPYSGYFKIVGPSNVAATNEVQNLIERCMLFHMSQEQCIRALAEHAGIKPLVTFTVWKELQKENKEFFRAYLQVVTPRPFISRYFQRASRLARRKHRKQ